MTGGKTKRNFIKQIFICCLGSVSFWENGEYKLLLTFRLTAYRVNFWFGGMATPELSSKANAMLTQSVSHLHPAVIIQLLLLPPPLHVRSSAGHLPPSQYWALQILLLGLYTETTEVGGGWWHPLSSCIQHNSYLLFHPCLPVRHS